MELYKKPVLTIVEMEKLDVLTTSSTGSEGESPMPDGGDDGDSVLRPRG